MTNLIRVQTKARVRFGTTYPAVDTEFQVECTGSSKSGYNSITVFRDMRDGTTHRGTTFVVGDTAEYDSYNLSYTGKIIKITDKTVTIAKTSGNGVKKHQLHINEFCWRNFNFNAADTAARNREESYSL